MKAKSIFWVIVVGVVLMMVWVGPAGCTRPEDTQRILSSNGYTEIQITGWRPFMASQDESFSTGFRAKSPSGSVVTGAVTSGLFKGSTIRLD